MKFGLINEEVRSTDYVLGHEEKLGGTVWEKYLTEEVINGDRVLSWKKWEPEYEYQRKLIETNACVSFSGNNVVEYITNYEIQRDLQFKSLLSSLGLIKNDKANFSDRRTAKGSGTDPNNGNTVRAVDDYLRGSFFCPEDLWPFLSDMDVWEYYKVMTSEVADFGKKLKPIITIETKYLNLFGGASSPDEIWEGLKYSPVWASVDGGNYQKVQSYSHRICIRGAVYGKSFQIHDHYQNQIVDLPWNYAFGACKIMRIIKNILPDYIQVGAAILFLSKGGKYAGQYIGYGDGDISKAITGGYPKPRVTLESLPPNYAGSLFIK